MTWFRKVAAFGCTQEVLVVRQRNLEPAYTDPEFADLSRREATDRLLTLALAASAADRPGFEDRVVRLNMTIARDVARRYRGRGIPSDDLDQVALLGLVKAVKGFKADRGADFLSFAVPTIRGEVRRYFRDNGWTVRPPRSIQELQARITAVESELVQELGRSPRPSEIAERLGEDISRVVDALSANGCFAPTSLDADTNDADDAGLGDRLGGADPGFASAEARVVLKPLFAGLDERERLILEMRFVRGCTQAEIGEAVGVTQMQVSRLLAGLLSRMRAQMTPAA
jgi:RNA polymerase sigma-B factor